MIQFYKKRDFGALMNDTFKFFKLYGKNYFKNFLLLNGPFILVLIILIYIGYDVFINPTLNGNLDDRAFFFEEYLEQNIYLFSIVGIFLLIFFIIMGILNYIFPVFYMKKLANYGAKEITMDDLLQEFKGNAKRIFYFSIGTIFVTAPLFGIIFGLVYLSVFLLIGLLLIFLVGPFLINAFSFHLFDYFNTEKSFFESLSYALRSQFSYPDGQQKSPFWKYIGLTLVMYFLINTISTLVMVLPAIVFITGYYTIDSMGSMSNDQIFILGFSIAYILMIFVSIILTNLIYVSVGFMYYDNRTDLHRKETLSEIDSIGNDS